MLDIRNIFELFPLLCFQIPFAKNNTEDINFEQERTIGTPSSVCAHQFHSPIPLPSQHYHVKSTKIS